MHLDQDIHIFLHKMHLTDVGGHFVSVSIHSGRMTSVCISKKRSALVKIIAACLMLGAKLSSEEIMSICELDA